MKDYSIKTYEEAIQVIEEVDADQFLVTYTDGESKEKIVQSISTVLTQFQKTVLWEPKLQKLNSYSSKESAKVLVNAMNKIVP